MQLSFAAALLAAGSAAHAFSDTSPFILFSTSSITTPALKDTHQLQTSNNVVSTAKGILSACTTEHVILVSQPGLHATDIRATPTGCHLPHLCRAISSDKTKGRFSVAEVVGQLLTQPLEDHVKAACKHKGKTAKVERLVLNRLPAIKDADKRTAALAENDHELGKVLDSLRGEYTVVVMSDPNEFQAYESDFFEPVHMDLRRGDGGGDDNDNEVVDTRVFVSSQRASNVTVDTRPLFEKYQFFTPAIFSGLIVVIIMFSILGVGIRALSSLEVSYGAFDKDSGPAAQKK